MHYKVSSHQVAIIMKLIKKSSENPLVMVIDCKPKGVEMHIYIEGIVSNIICGNLDADEVARKFDINIKT